MTPRTINGMNVELHQLDDGASTISSFAKRHGLTMVVRERPLSSRTPPDERYYASFKDAEISDGGAILISPYCPGPSTIEAIYAYARRIAGKTLVIDAGSESRREIQCPNDWIMEPQSHKED